MLAHTIRCRLMRPQRRLLQDSSICKMTDVEDCRPCDGEGNNQHPRPGLTVDYRIMQAQAVILAAAIGAYVLAALFAERRGSEARLARANAMLERERDNRLLNAQAVTAVIAHEIRQPLAPKCEVPEYRVREYDHRSCNRLLAHFSKLLC
jgi:hypothetical protein